MNQSTYWYEVIENENPIAETNKEIVVVTVIRNLNPYKKIIMNFKQMKMKKNNNKLFTLSRLIWR